MRKLIENLQQENSLLESKSARVEELENDLELQRRNNRSLEDKITRLCESPFVGDAFGQQAARMRLEDVEREKEEMRVKVDHLQEAVKTHYSALVTLKQQEHS